MVQKEIARLWKQREHAATSSTARNDSPTTTKCSHACRLSIQAMLLIRRDMIALAWTMYHAPNAPYDRNTTPQRGELASVPMLLYELGTGGLPLRSGQRPWGHPSRPCPVRSCSSALPRQGAVRGALRSKAIMGLQNGRQHSSSPGKGQQRQPLRCLQGCLPWSG